MSTGWAGDNRDHKHFGIFKTSGTGARWGALSRFSQNIGRVLLRLYTRAGDTVVDPFAGHNSRMELCYRDRRNYIGCDISAKFMAANFELQKRLLDVTASSMFPSLNKATIELHECDSRKMPVKNNAGDFTITSPPYWDLEYYGDEVEQLGKDNDYNEFLRRLGAVACENFRCVKSGAFVVWCINDFRKDGKFYPFHMHTAQLLRDAGFKWHDILIIDLGHSYGAVFATQIVSTKILPKRHEYALIFRKP
jgi:DNA modification methylase